MKRYRPLRRSPFRPRQPNTAPATSRPAATRIEWEAIQSQVRSRAGWRCQACGRRGRLDVHHVIKRSRGGSDFDLDRLVALCRACHDQTDAPLASGRLIVTPMGEGRFTFEVVYGPAKYRWPARPFASRTAGKSGRTLSVV
jgi:5-methylcytosine-specific restriction endonuclease McrA